MTTAQDGGKFVSLRHRPPLPPRNTPGTHLCWRLSRPQGHIGTGRNSSSSGGNGDIIGGSGGDAAFQDLFSECTLCSFSAAIMLPAVSLMCS